MGHRDEYRREAATLTAITGKLACSPDSLRVWNQRDSSERTGQTSCEKAPIKELEREVPKFRRLIQVSTNTI